MAVAGGRPSVLVVEDERDLADLYVAWLRDDYDARAAYTGEGALEELDAGVDVVLLDRRLPDVSGDEVLVSIRDRGLDCRVAMVTAVSPGVGVLDLGFDDYLTKPVGREAVRETVEHLLEVTTLEDIERRLSTLRVRRNVVRQETPRSELVGDERFERLERRIADLKHRRRVRRQAVAATPARRGYPS